MSAAAGTDLSEELLAVIAAAAAVAVQRQGVARAAVTRVAPVSEGSGPSPWVWAGRLELMAGRRSVQRRGR